MPSVDTNVLLRWLLADVPAQAERVDELLASGEQFTVDDAALIEVVFVLERVLRLGRRSVADAIRTVISTAAFDLDRQRWSTLATDYVAHTKLSVADLYLAQRAVERGAVPLYTFDTKLAAQINQAVLPG
ncbi:MAG: PIN domain-containing protein [Micropruina sp.]|nr:PIN domain-containing protein [Micropruina sp.]